MCNKGIDYLNETHNSVDSQPNHDQVIHLMDTPPSVTHSTAGSHDETPRVKLLCSFLGSIMPRPQDGKLRYVGGETRIVSLPRDISFDGLMSKMKELYEGAVVLKYQQPDEDLDALVSVVNDDDVTNMMEEYEKMGSGDGFTRLRIFLFSCPDQDCSPHYVDGGDTDSERRYVDALNNLNEGADFRRQQADSPLVGAFEDIHLQEQFFNPIDSGLHGQRNVDMAVPLFNLHQITVPQRHSEGSWSPAYYSPRHNGHPDPRSFPEFPNSPPSRYHIHFGEFAERGMDRISEEYARLQLNQPPVYDHPVQFAENIGWIPPGTVSADKAGFPGNLLHASGIADCNSGCEHCRAALHRSYLHLEQPDIGNVVNQSPNQCAQCHPNREHFLLNAETKVHSTMYPKDWNGTQSIYSEAHGHERGLSLPHQLSSQALSDEVRTHISGAGRINEHYIVDGTEINYPLGHVNLVDGHRPKPDYIHHGAGHDLGDEVFHDQPMAASRLLHTPSPEERAVRYGNFHYAYGVDSPCPVSHGHLHPQNLWRNVQSPMHGASPYETSATTLPVNGTVNPTFLMGTSEGSQRTGIGMDSPHSRVDSPQKILVFDGTSSPECAYGYPLKMNSNHHVSINKTLVSSETSQTLLPCEVQNSSAVLGAFCCNPELISSTTELAPIGQRGVLRMEEAHGVEKVKTLDIPTLPVNGTVNPTFVTGTSEGSQRIGIGMDSPHSVVDSPQKIFGFDETSSPEYAYVYPSKLNSNHHVSINKTLLSSETSQTLLPCEVQNSSAILGAFGCNPELINSITKVALMGQRSVLRMEDANCLEKVETLDIPNMSHVEQNVFARTDSGVPVLGSVSTEKGGGVVKMGENDVVGDTNLSLDRLSFFPELMASVKKAALEEAVEVKARVETANTGNYGSLSKEANLNESDAVKAHEEPELGSDSHNINNNKIEPTKAEAEAIERGLQTIKNDDLEEIRELGSGTYGAVYHGKWKGSDVAIKRIKASCFAGRPSERERLIADFWKEALILSSLHHPNVVSFYGIVRDGPDGSLATVTEFMVNGSLKQFLQKKDRTIDRRKRLIIAMDVAFGMEYLHGKNIVHFDLKCENLLVNMKDPQRPVCKIGDLGLSKVKQHTLVSGGVRGTLPWMAPELLSGKSHMVTEKIDVYSFGIVMWELLTGEEPYVGLHCASIIGGIVNDSLRPDIPPWCDPEWKSLMESCWASDPVTRPSFSEISKKLRNMAAAVKVK